MSSTDKKDELSKEQHSDTDIVALKPDIAALKPTLIDRVLEFVFLLLATIVLAVSLVISLITNLPGAVFQNASTGAGADLLEREISPASWTFAVWGPIYLAQIMWIVYAWTYVFRPATPRGISFVTYIFSAIANLSGCAWLYIYGFFFQQAALGVIIVYAFFLYASLIAQAIHLYKQTPALSATKKFKIDLYLTRIIVLNSLAIYATWMSVATQLNFLTVLQFNYGVDSTTAGTVGLSILLVEIVVYFILENTILDRFARYIFIVYPVLIWTFIGSLARNWERLMERRNPIFSLVLLVLCIVLFIFRIILWIVFAFKRPLAVPKLQSAAVV